MKSTSLCLLICALMLFLAVFDAHAADKPKRTKYVAPAGFDGRQWGELRTSADFASLPERPMGVGAAWMQPAETDFHFTCMPPSAYDISNGVDPGACDPMTTLNSLRRKVEGGGFYVLSEYSIDDQGARLGGERGVLAYPVIYQFCANWDGKKKSVPPTFDALNQFCGMRLMFNSETREELRDLPSDHHTRYDRVLDFLIANYGKPQGFRQRGQVDIQDAEGGAVQREMRKFRTWRWCPAGVGTRELHTSCAASVVLSLDLATGLGTVLYSTPLLWEYAYAREHNGFEGDKLYKVLQARR
jgi:hypothetical protein